MCFGVSSVIVMIVQSHCFVEVRWTSKSRHTRKQQTTGNSDGGENGNKSADSRFEFRVQESSYKPNFESPPMPCTNMRRFMCWDLGRKGLALPSSIIIIIIIQTNDSHEQTSVHP